MYIAKRRMRFGGRSVKPGDALPEVERLHRFKIAQLLRFNKIAKVPDAVGLTPGSADVGIEPAKEIEPSRSTLPDAAPEAPPSDAAERPAPVVIPGFVRVPSGSQKRGKRGRP